MIRLVIPDPKYLHSYMEAYDTYRARNVTTYFFDDARSYNIFDKYEQYRNEANLPPGRVGSDFYWLVDDEADYFIGEISIRHRLTESLKRYGGHIGYGIRYEEWNKGYGRQMLHLALPAARDLQIDTCLITCDDDNIASAKVMEYNGFTLQDKIRNTIDGKEILTRRYTRKLQDQNAVFFYSFRHDNQRG